ncbi:type IV pilus secretin family protein [Nitrospina watsonii]|uniref:Bacterial type II and III secretion system protein n=1 Tax=Nitrospina watsonii TaxID=1323948 RepID=A0ABM9HHK7_9BACT|nr:type IV pilus secretin family protein [Nitrospina watsonii]CAI2719542.1 Putative bacterial type II and III secretion system protein [Nitrospina watsonii]
MKTKNMKIHISCLTAVLLVVGLTAFPVFGATGDKGDASVKPGTIEHNKISVTKSGKSVIGKKGKSWNVAQMTGEAPASVMNEIQDLTAVQEGAETSIKLKISGSLNYTAFKLENPLRLVLDFPGTVQGILTGPIQVNQGIVNAVTPTYFEEAKVLRLEIGLSQTASYEIVKTGPTSLDVRIQAASAEKKQDVDNKMASSFEEEMGMKKGKKSGSLYESGSKASLEDSCSQLLGGQKEAYTFDFQNASLKNIFRIISDVSGFNVVLSPDVSGNVNVRLVDVSWNTALELILDNYGLARKCQENIIRIAPKASLVAAKKSEPLVTEMIRISYADIAEMVTNLEKIKSADRGQISSDTRTNTLILTDIEDKIEEMESVIKTLDIKTPQVMIESRIIEIARSFTQDLGLQWTLNNNIDVANPGFPTQLDGEFLVDLASNVATPAGLYTLTMSDADHQLQITLAAAESEGKSRTIANPKVTTLDNKEAKIRSGREIPYQTFSANEGTKIEFVDAEINLTVKPHITAEEDVYMKITATQNQADFSQQVNNVPTIVTKEANSEVLVDNGATVVLGGLFQQEINENRVRVPFLHQIPILGYLFKNRSQDDTISELLIFVTPTIVRENIE